MIKPKKYATKIDQAWVIQKIQELSNWISKAKSTNLLSTSFWTE